MQKCNSVTVLLGTIRNGSLALGGNGIEIRLADFKLTWGICLLMYCNYLSVYVISMR